MTSARWPLLIAALFCAARAAADGMQWPKGQCDPDKQDNPLFALYCGLPDGDAANPTPGHSDKQSLQTAWAQVKNDGDAQAIFGNALHTAPAGLQDKIAKRWGPQLEVTAAGMEKKAVVQKAEDATQGAAGAARAFDNNTTRGTQATPVSAGGNAGSTGATKEEDIKTAGAKLDQPDKVPGAYPAPAGDAKKPFKLDDTQKAGVVSGFWGALLGALLMGPAGLILMGAVAGAAGYLMAKQGSDDDGGGGGGGPPKPSGGSSGKSKTGSGIKTDAASHIGGGF